MQRLSRFIGFGYLGLCVVVLIYTVLIGPLGPAAPFALPIGPARTPVEVTIWYGTEKEVWLETALERFNAENRTLNGRPVRITLVGLGSREIAVRTAQQDFGDATPPTVVSPASTLQVELLKSDWQTRNNTEIIPSGADAPQPTVLTPLVVVAWEDRANVLWGNGLQAQNFWQDIHAAVADPQGWAGRGKPEWGFVKFGHTSPITSNSGTQTLLLLAYGYYNKTTGLTSADILNPDFQKWLLEIENSVLEFGDSTGTFMTNMVRFGPSKYDIVAVYENVALQDIQNAQNRWGQNIRIYYPPATLFSDHPYAILDAPWVSPEQRDAARMFRDYLLSEPIQQLALESGFRPANPNVAVVTNAPNNPFNAYQSFGVQIDIPQVVETPQADVILTLQDLWNRQVRR
jgi:ABC-type Fe3+ transport system substrate-binding protein